MTVALTDFLRLYVPRVSVPNVAQSFHYDQVAVIEYIYSLYDEKTASSIFVDTKAPAQGLVLSEVLLFPSRVGMDPRRAETVGWASFACERTLFDTRSGSYETGSRFPDPDDFFLLLDAGVPLAYASGVVTLWGEYPTDKVITAWHEGMPIEYLGVALGS